MRNRLLVALALLAAAPAHLAAQAPADSAAIRAAALDYIEGWYGGDAAWMERALHPELAKRIVRGGEGGSTLGHMGMDELVEGTRRGGGNRTPAEHRRADVRILDVYGNAASVRVDAATWVDYLHLGRVDGQWKIINVLWEMRPRGS